MFKTISTTIALQKPILEIAWKKSIKRIFPNIQKNLYSTLVTNIDNKYKDISLYKQIEGAFKMKDSERIFTKLDEILSEFYLSLRNKDINNEDVQKEMFEQIIFMSNLVYGTFIKGKFGKIFNTINKYNIDTIKDDSIGNQLKHFLHNKKDDLGNGFNCRNRTTILIKFLEELRSSGLNISNMIFLEKNGKSNHSGIITTFQGKRYLVDTTNLNNKIIQPLDEIMLYENYPERWDLSKHEDNNGNIIKSSPISIKKFGENNIYLDKIFFDNYEDFLKAFKELPQEMCVFHARSYDIKNALRYALGIYISISSNGIVLRDRIFFQFNDNIKNIDSVSDDQIIDFIINNIYNKNIILQDKNYPQYIIKKTDGKIKESDKRLLKKYLSEVIKRSDIGKLRAVLKTDSNKFIFNQ